MSILNDLKQAKLLGHPIHSMLIHFPIALLSASVVLDALGYVTKGVTFALAAYYTLTGGVWSAVALALLLISSHLGGDLIFRDGMGRIDNDKEAVDT